MKKIFKFIKKRWFGILITFLFIATFILIFTVVDNIWKEVYSIKYEKSDEIEKLEQRIKKLELDQIVDNLTNSDVIDPYSANFQKINESFAVVIKDIKEYGSGSKVSFSILNKDSVSYDDLEFNFQVRDRMSSREFNALAHNKYAFTKTISSGYSRDGEVIFSEVKPDQIKALKITVNNTMINYYSH